MNVQSLRSTTTAPTLAAWRSCSVSRSWLDRSTSPLTRTIDASSRLSTEIFSSSGSDTDRSLAAATSAWAVG
jgi:hypothetical protein